MHHAVQHIARRSQDGAQGAAEIKGRAEQTNIRIINAQEKAAHLKNEIQLPLKRPGPEKQAGALQWLPEKSESLQNSPGRL